MSLYISVVNHNHDEMICNNGVLGELSKKHTVIVKSNTPASSKLKNYCEQHKIHLIQGRTTKGFSSNNNEVFHYAHKYLEMNSKHWFLVLNPDVVVSLSAIDQLLNEVNLNERRFYSISLYKDADYSIYDNSIRKFPSFLDPLRDMLDRQRKDLYNREQISEIINVDWTAGSFMLFPYDVYNTLQGFDERYFMYYEDVDLCRRAKKHDISVTYIPHVKAIHYAACDNRNILSTNGLHYLRSYLRYFFL